MPTTGVASFYQKDTTLLKKTRIFVFVTIPEDAPDVEGDPPPDPPPPPIELADEERVGGGSCNIRRICSRLFCMVLWTDRKANWNHILKFDRQEDMLFETVCRELSTR